MTEWNNGIASIVIPTPFAVGDVNAFIVKGDALTLIDAGPKTEETRQAIEAGLKDLHLEKKDIEQIIITHHHPDHVGGVDFFPESTVLLGHENNNYWLVPSDEVVNEYEQFFFQMAKEMGVPEAYHAYIVKMGLGLKYSCTRKLTQTLKEGDTVPGLEQWKVYETPGHAQSHIVLLRESDGVMIGGDLLLNKISPNPLIEPPMIVGEDRPKSQLLLNNSLKALLNMHVSKVYAGHGGIVEDVHNLVLNRLQAQHERAMKVRDMLKVEPLTTFQVCMQLFPKVIQKQPGLTLSETLAQLDYLMDLGDIRGEETEQGVLYYVQ